MQKISLSVPSPCHQNWDKMTPTEMGKFCGACAKQVVDFTSFSDEDMVNYFSKKASTHTTGSTCGRFSIHQLDQPLYKWEFQNSSKWYWKFLAFFIFLFAKQTGAKAQQIVGKLGKVPSTTEIVNMTAISNAEPAAPRAVSIKVKDSKGRIVPNAKVVVEGTGQVLVTSKNGTVAFLLGQDARRITVTANGFTEKIITVNGAEHYEVVLAKNKKEEPVIMGVVVAQ